MTRGCRDLSRVALASSHFLIRPGRRRDIDAIIAYFERNASRLAQSSPLRPAAFYGRKFWKDRLAAERRAEKQGSALRLFLFPHGEPTRVVGTVSLTDIRGEPCHWCELGYGLDAEWEGRSAMREALETVLRFAFEVLGLHRVMANCRPLNVRSRGLLTRLGFIEEGYARQYLRLNGRWEDHVLMARINDSDGT